MISLNIITQVTALGIIMLCSAVLYVFLVAYVLPRCCLKPRYNLHEIRERGIKKYLFKNGRAIVYEPSVYNAKYIKQYILSRNDDEKYIKCKTDERIYSIQYDVIAYDAGDKVIGIVEVSESILNPGYTSGALLPPKTAYVSVIVKQVNGTKIKSEADLKMPLKQVIGYAVSAVACSVIEGSVFYLLVHKCFDMAWPAFGGIVMADYFAAIPIFAVLGVLVAAVAVVGCYSKDFRIKK
jgi:hypothetical protein